MRLTAVMAIMGSGSYAQTAWTKHTGNPVMAITDPYYEFFAIGQPACLWEGDTFKMWYAAAGFPYLTSRFFYAYSQDGIQWTKHGDAEPVLLPGGVGAWDIWIDTPEIVRVPGGYHLFYFGDTTQGGYGRKPSALAAIGLASSLDGIYWERNPSNPVFGRDSTIDWERHWIESPAVLYDSVTGLYRMWYSGVDTSTWHIQIGLATSPNCVNWFREASNPVVANGPPGSCDDVWASVPAVIKRDSLYEMWYSALSTTGGFGNIGICYATSADGVTWNKDPGNPLFTTTTQPHSMAVDSGGPWAPDVTFDGVSFSMWYETVAGFCLATSPLSGATADPTTVPRPLAENVLVAHPNPAFDMALFSYHGYGSLPANVGVYDIAGRRVRIICLERRGGRVAYRWDCRDENGRRVSPGTYFVVLAGEGLVKAGAKVLVLR